MKKSKKDKMGKLGYLAIGGGVLMLLMSGGGNPVLLLIIVLALWVFKNDDKDED